MTCEERHELILAAIDVHPEYHKDAGNTEQEIMAAAYKQALIDLFRYAANRLEKAEVHGFDFGFDFALLNEFSIDLLRYKWDYKFQVTLRNLKPSPSTEAPK